MKNYRNRRKKKVCALTHKTVKTVPILEKEYGIKRFVKTDSGKIMGAYLGNDLMHPLKIEKKDGDLFIFFSTYEKSIFYYHREKIIKSSDNIKEL